MTSSLNQLSKRVDHLIREAEKLSTIVRCNDCGETDRAQFYVYMTKCTREYCLCKRCIKIRRTGSSVETHVSTSVELADNQETVEELRTRIAELEEENEALHKVIDTMVAVADHVIGELSTWNIQSEVRQ